ncbi:MAG: type II toxin-antitoxin system RelE/ParE family toxin [Chloroflexota bacterium]|nr:type II toxin-antitoxin system RelE/ParE family toxin [Chloroflexota bacterium]
MTSEEDAASPAKPKYRDKRTAQFAAGERVRALQAIERQTSKRLEILEAAPNKEALRRLPRNRFEALGGDSGGQFSIRINDQWRIRFAWLEGDPVPFNSEIVDYH